MADVYDLLNEVHIALPTSDATSISGVEPVRVGLKDRYLLKFRLHIVGWCCKLAYIIECGRCIANAR